MAKQTTANTPPKHIDAYHGLFTAEQQQLLQKMRQAIQQAAPKAIETISYGMPAFKQHKVLVYYAMNKNHIGFYPTANPIVVFKNELAAYKTSKGAIQFPLDKPLPVALIKKIVKLRVAEDAPQTKAKQK